VAEPTQKPRRAAAKPERPKTAAKAAHDKAIARKPAYLQAKLAVSHPRDSQEQEADRVAGEVSRTPRAVAPRSVQRSAAGAPQENHEIEDQHPLAAVLAIQRLPDQQRSSGEERLAEEAARALRQAESTQERIAPSVVSDPRPDQARLARRAAAGQAQDAVAGQPLDADSEQRIEARRGGGDPLPEDVLHDMQSRFGQDFSRVRVHTDAEAAALCKRLNAHAFTVGNDIFFAPGEFAPATERGRNLLAHELTHVVQQGGGAARRVQRDPDPAGAADEVRDNCRRVGAADITYTIFPATNLIRFNKLQTPPYKVPFLSGHPLRRPRGFRRVDSMRNAHYTGLWRQGVGQASIAAVSGYLNQRLDREYQGQPRPSIFAFRARNGFRRGTDRSPIYRCYIGTVEDIARELAFPTWDKNGGYRSFDLDHKWEMQLGGSNQLDNLWLLNSTTNENSGRAIYNNLRNRNAKGVSENEKRKGDGKLPGTASSDQVLDNYDMEFEKAVADTGFNPSDPVLPDRYFWEQGEITSGAHVNVANFDTLLEIDNLEAAGGNGKAKVFPGPGGGVGKLFKTTGRVAADERDWLKPWRIAQKEFFASADNPSVLGRFQLILPDNKATEPVDQETLTIPRYPGAEFAGHLDLEKDFVMLFGDIVIRGLSPVRFDSVSLSEEGGLLVRGAVLPTVPLLADTELDLEIANGEINVFKRFSAGDFNIPGPIELDRVSLTVGLGSRRGLYAEGRLDFSITGIGQGYLESAIGSGESFALAGGFDFDTSLFDPARVQFRYADGALSATGTIGIPAGKVPGVKSADVNVSYADDVLSAEGQAELDVSGVERGTLSVTYSEADGICIGGSFELSPDIPGIRSGSVRAELRQRPDGGGYALSASGEAVPDIPGFNSRLRVAYDDGAITAEGEAEYQRGMLSGRVRAGATNRTLDAEGNPTGAPGEQLICYGGGSVTIRIAPWLQGTAGIAFAPNGEVTVTGEIALPSSVEIFARREINKSIFDVAVQAPIVPGIVAEVGGGLSANAGIGPGVIDQLRLGIEYNPAREEDTHVTGDAHLRVPADAGLRLAARAGIGLGITGASATGGLEIGGALGIEGAAEAGVHIDWMPGRGLELNADVAVYAQPAFTFDVSGYVSVRVLGFSVYSERWRLASFQYGSDMRFGISLPVHYREGEPFDVSLDDVRFETPNIDTRSLIRGLIARIA